MADSEDDEDYALYGTPLDPIDEDNLPRKKPIGIEEQIATDKNGRRRFHGAFTGGFSAGFFNSVGSLEGWTPTTFKSSRSSKMEGIMQKPEDFMDDEDREEFGIAPEVLRAKPEYGGNRGTKRNRPTFSDGPIPGEPVLNSVIKPVRETVGVQLLMLMGWKPGQGVGPRLSLLEKKRSALRRKKANKEAGATPTSDSEDDLESLDLDPDLLFAPDDYEVRCSRPKVDTQGMGYKGLDRALLSSASSSQERFSLFEPTLRLEDNKKKLSIRGQAFGVGAFEEEDEDIYKQDDMRNYDFALETHNSLALKRKQEKAQLAIAHPSDVIEGFVKAKETNQRKKYYRGPEVPPGWTPQPRRSRFDVRPNQAIQSNTKLTASERSVIIGESSGDKIRESKEEALKMVEDVKTEASGFRPFETDSDKQDRYEKFLKFVKIGAKDAFCKVQPPTMTDWEKERERNEFEQAARLYTPLSGVIAERFTTGTSSAELEEEKKILSDMEIAAQKKMFGQLTRKVFDWTPCSLVCKRFNIPQPNAEGTLEKTAQEKNKSRMKFSVFDFLDASKKNQLSSLQCGQEAEVEEAEVVKIKEEPPDKPTPDKSSETAPVPASQLFDDEVIDLEETGNKMDLFKAIFENSDDESEDETDKPPETKEQPNKATSEPLRNTSPPRGIFANLDLDALSNSRKPKETPVTPAPKETETEPEDPLAYGPKLPQVKFTNVSLPQPKILTVIDNSSSSSSSSEEEWVEKSSKHSKKHSKKSHKKSKKKEKHKKHKKKKKKSK